jgi:hypothetical protein
MDDFEIRQVFSIIKDRVIEIKQDLDWKEKIAQEWNQANDLPEAAPVEKEHSVYSYSKSRSTYFDLFWFRIELEVSKISSYEYEVKSGRREEQR